MWYERSGPVRTPVGTVTSSSDRVYSLYDFGDEDHVMVVDEGGVPITLCNAADDIPAFIELYEKSHGV